MPRKDLVGTLQLGGVADEAYYLQLAVTLNSSLEGKVCCHITSSTSMPSMLFNKDALLQPVWTKADGNPFEKIEKILAAVTMQDISIKDSDNEDAIAKKLATAKSGKRTKAANKINWLSVALKKKIDEYAPKAGNINSNGIANKEKLAEEITKLLNYFKKKQAYVNIYQLRDAVNQFGDQWGFQVTIHDSWQLKCYFAKSSSKFHELAVSPSKQHNHPSIKVDCTFVVRCAPNLVKRKVMEHHCLPIYITTFMPNHNNSCSPSIAQICMAKKKTEAMFGKLDLSEIGIAAKMIACPSFNA